MKMNETLAKIEREEEVSAQEVFDQSWRVVSAQNRRSINREGCAYRGANGAVCGVGACIPDSLYDFRMDLWSSDPKEGTDVTTINRRGLLPKSLVPHLKLLGAIQFSHDEADTSFGCDEVSSFQEDFRMAMKKVADKWHLAWPALDEAT